MSDQIHAERRAFRAGRVRLAFLTSAGSKTIGLIVQFLAFPLAVRSLGPERFGIYTMLVSVLLWIDLGRLGIGPGLTRELAIAWNRGQQDRERMLFSNAMFLLLGIVAVIGAVLAAAYVAALHYIDRFFGPSAVQFQSEVLAGIGLVGIFMIAHVVFNIGEAARSAYQDDFITNLMNTLGNVASLLLMFWVALYWPTIPGFALAVFGALVLGKAANLALLLFKSRPYLFPRWRYVDRTEFRPLMGTSLAFWVAQIAVLVMHSLPLLQLGQMLGAGALTPFAVVFRLLQLLSTAVLMISTPLWPAITDAAVRGDIGWIKRAYRRLALSALGFCTLVALTLTLFGSTLIPLWAGKSVQTGMAFNAMMGGYFIIWMWNHSHAMVLYGLGKLWDVAWAMLAEGVLVLVLAAVLIPRCGAMGTAIALCVAGMGVTAWILPYLVRRTLAHPIHVDETGLAPAGLAGSPLPEEATL